MLAELVQRATNELQEVAETGQSVQNLESSLYCISSIHEAVPMDEETAATQLFTGPLIQTLTKLTGPHYQRLQRAALRLIGKGLPSRCYQMISAHNSCFRRGIRPMVPPQQQSSITSPPVYCRLSQSSTHLASSRNGPIGSL